MHIKTLLHLTIFLIASLTAKAAPYVTADSVLTVTRDTRVIPAFAFEDRCDIKRVVFENPRDFEAIGDYAFLGCASLEEIELPAGLKSIGEGAFRECLSLREITIPARITKLPRYVFSFCSSLRKARLPRELLDIGSGCFSYCGNLEEVYLPPRLEHIGANAFSFCRKLEKIEMPASIKELESYAFSECDSLRNAVLPANGNMLGELIFSGCRNLEEITCLSKEPPPFDCNNTLFEENEDFMYEKCKLRVLSSKINAYKNAPGWRFFRTIYGVSVVK